MTTTTKRRWPLAEALPLAHHLRRRLAPGCDRIEVAGSIRRRAPTVGDVELVVIPRLTSYPTDLFGSTRVYDHLDEWIKTLIATNVLAYRPTTIAARTYGSLNKFLVDTATGMSLDIFSTTVQNWGMTMVVRTGPAKFNIKVMSQLRALGLLGHAYGGVTDAQGVQHDCPDEETVFHFLQWPYAPPEARQ